MRIRRGLSREALPEDAFLQCTQLPAFHEWNQLAYSGKGDLCSDRCICHTGSITVLARIFDQPADRIADQTEHVHKNSGCCGKGLSGDPPISSTVADAAIADAIPTSA